MKQFLPSMFFFIVFYILLPVKSNASETDPVEIYLIQGEYEKVIERLLPQIKESPENISDYYHLGMAYQGLDKHDRAIEVMKIAEKWDNKNIKILAALGKSYSALGRYRDAEKTFKRILDLDNHNKIAKTTQKYLMNG